MKERTMKKVAFYCQDTRDPDDTADDHWQRLQAATQAQDAHCRTQMVTLRNRSGKINCR